MSLKNKYFDFPIVNQEKNYTCGCACVNALLKCYGEETYIENDMCELIDATTQYGTSYKSIAAFFKSEGYQVFYKQNLTIEDIKGFLDEGHPVLVAFQAWSEQKYVRYQNKWNCGHYAICVGYDDLNFYFMDPSLRDYLGFITIKSFKKRHHDTDGEFNEKLVQFGMLIVGPKPKVEIKSVRKKNFKKIG
jgi:predicted double-glycine peptidase